MRQTPRFARTRLVLASFLVAFALIGLVWLAAFQHRRIRVLEARLSVIEGRVSAVLSGSVLREFNGHRYYILPLTTPSPGTLGAPLVVPRDSSLEYLGVPGPNYDQWDFQKAHFDRLDRQ